MCKNWATLYNVLDDYLKQNKKKLRDLFDQHDKESKGYLDSNDLFSMMHSIMPGLKPCKVRIREGDPGRGGLQGTRPHAGQLGGPASRGA
eukprot:1182375-Prorocentrum_minimum.AAC.1